MLRRLLDKNILVFVVSSFFLLSSSYSAKPKICKSLLTSALSQTWINRVASNLKQSDKLEIEALRHSLQSSEKGFLLNPKILKKHNTHYTKEITQIAFNGQGESGNCWIIARHNSIVQRLIHEGKLRSDFKLSVNYNYMMIMVEVINASLHNIVKSATRVKTSKAFIKYIKENRTVIDDGGFNNYFPMLVSKYGFVPYEAMPDTASTKNTTVMREDLNEAFGIIVAEIAKKHKQMLDSGKELTPKKRREELTAIKARGMMMILNVLKLHLGQPPETFDVILNTKTTVKNVTPLKFAREIIGYNHQDYVVVGAYKGLEEKVYYKIKDTDVAIQNSGAQKFDMEFLNLNNDRLEELVIQAVNTGIPVETLVAYTRGVDRKTGILHPEIRLNKTIYLKAGKAYKFKPENPDLDTALGNVTTEHLFVITGYDKPDDSKNVVKYKVFNSHAPAPLTVNDINNPVAEPGVVHMYREWFKSNVFEILIPKNLLTKEELEVLEAKPKILKSVDDVY
ncbi:MAG: hypothetical protein IPM57_11465 [Oligoflexia bacterium]|nr:hypothetical protein [Oligoflexia bacterium]